MTYQESLGSNLRAAAVTESSEWVITIYDRVKRLIDTWVDKRHSGRFAGAAASVSRREAHHEIF